MIRIPEPERWPPNSYAPPMFGLDRSAFRATLARVISETLAIVRALGALGIEAAIGEGAKSRIVAVIGDEIIIEVVGARGVIRDQLISKLEREVGAKLANAFGPDVIRFEIEGGSL